MKRLMTPTLQMSLGLLSLTLSLIFIAFSFGLLPNEDKAALEARAAMSETLATQLANLASRNEAEAIKDTIDAVVGRAGDILSVAVRGVDGELLAGSNGHERLWVEPANGQSTPTHVQVPLLNGDAPAGRIEIVYRPLATGRSILGLPESMLGFIGFIAFAGFAGYYVILKRALRELDPGRAIPERVKAAFDTLAEGVLIMDEREFVLLANDAFAKNIYQGTRPLLGSVASDLPWVRAETVSLAPEFPWRTAMRSEQSVLGVPMGIRSRSGELQRLIVNATRIVDGNGKVRGVITTFDDVTVLHQTNAQLNDSIQQLNRSQAKISEQNKQLQFLAANDSLTRCLNRRTFFAEAEARAQEARDRQLPMSFLMLDVDHFKSVNDRFGHMTGDKVLSGLADLLKACCSAQDLVGRYGGEEFCIAVTGMADDDVERLADRIRRAVAEVRNWLPTGERVTISIGMASLGNEACALSELVKRADEALYAAKAAGRNRLITWHGTARPGPAQGRSAAWLDALAGSSPTLIEPAPPLAPGLAPSDRLIRAAR